VLSFPAKNGGFSYFGDTEGDIALTAYALRFFADAGEFIEIDSKKSKNARQWLLEKQKPDGSWEGGDTRPPLGGRNPFVYTALAVRGLKVYAPPGRQEETTARIVRAREFLRRVSPVDTQEEAFKLLGLVWAGGSRVEVTNQMKRLHALQHRDGGWSQLPTMPSDAYASGQALYALRVAGAAASSDSYRKGVQYLLRTQLEDGTWYVRSRAIGFQPYVDSGFPHGPDQFISAAATAWAVIALSHAL